MHQVSSELVPSALFYSEGRGDYKKNASMEPVKSNSNATEILSPQSFKHT